MAVVTLSNFTTATNVTGPAFLIGYTNATPNGEQKFTLDTIVASLPNSANWTASLLPTHTHSASQITSGILDAARIPSLDAAKIATGTLDAARIPSLDASKITTGTISIDRIPSIPSTKITGSLALDNFATDTIPSAAIVSIQNDSRLISNFLDKRQISRQTILGEIRFGAYTIADRQQYMSAGDWSAWPYSLAFNGFYSIDGKMKYSQTSSLLEFSSDASIRIINAIRNTTTVNNASNTVQLNAEGARYISTGIPSNNVGANGDIYISL